MRMKAILSMAIVVLVYQIAWAQIPETINYQGILNNADGSAVADGFFNLVFRLYDVETGGTNLWSESVSTFVKDGLLSVILGETIPLTLSFDRQLWLGITVSGGTELTPRSKLTSVPYSLNSLSVADNAVSLEKINTTGASPNQTIVFDGNVLAWGQLTPEPVTRYLSIGSNAFELIFNQSRSNFGYKIEGKTWTGDVTDYADIFIPHGATITKISFYWHDTLPTDDCTLELFRNNMDGTFTSIASMSSTGSNGNGNSFSSTISLPIVDNSQYSYYLKLSNLKEKDTDGQLYIMEFYGVILEYTIDY